MGVVSLSYFMVLRRYTVTLTESFVLCLLLNTEGASQNNHQSVSRCLSAEWNKNANIWQVTIFTAFSAFICLQQGADLHIAQPMPLPFTVSCSSKIQIGFTFLLLAHLGSPGQRAVKRVCVTIFKCTSCHQQEHVELQSAKCSQRITTEFLCNRDR